MENDLTDSRPTHSGSRYCRSNARITAVS